AVQRPSSVTTAAAARTGLVPRDQGLDGLCWVGAENGIGDTQPHHFVARTGHIDGRFDGARHQQSPEKAQLASFATGVHANAPDQPGSPLRPGEHMDGLRVREYGKPLKYGGGFVAEHGVRPRHGRRVHAGQVSVPGRQRRPQSGADVDPAPDRQEFSPRHRPFRMRDVPSSEERKWRRLSGSGTEWRQHPAMFDPGIPRPSLRTAFRAPVPSSRPWGGRVRRMVDGTAGPARLLLRAET
ncbi:MAG: hypothetical protein K0R99_4362, partial [Microbacterium sp.]|nr:hypothetical protein [Microbacterium sp.]